MRVGIIGGSGLYNMNGVEGLEEVEVKTPFGTPSDSVLCGTLDGHPVAFLPRHGRGHVHNPTEVNYRANIWALKSLGCESLISVGGSARCVKNYPLGISCSLTSSSTAHVASEPILSSRKAVLLTCPLPTRHARTCGGLWPKRQPNLALSTPSVAHTYVSKARSFRHARSL